jgi:hypothetical protein
MENERLRLVYLQLLAGHRQEKHFFAAAEPAIVPIGV